MYERGKEVTLEASVGVMVKNLQVVSFDSEWLEIYLGTVCINVAIFLIVAMNMTSFENLEKLHFCTCF